MTISTNDYYVLSDNRLVQHLYRVAYSIAAVYGPNHPSVNHALLALEGIHPEAAVMCGEDIAVDIVGG